jgi:DNA-binding Xre family transcriptional regulator
MDINSTSSTIKVIHMIPIEYTATLIWKKEHGEKIQELRGKTAREKVSKFLADKGISYSQESLRKLENGTTQSIDVQVFLSLCDFFNIHPSALIPFALVGVSNNFNLS